MHLLSPSAMSLAPLLARLFAIMALDITGEFWLGCLHTLTSEECNVEVASCCGEARHNRDSSDPDIDDVSLLLGGM